MMMMKMVGLHFDFSSTEHSSPKVSTVPQLCGKSRILPSSSVFLRERPMFSGFFF